MPELIASSKLIIPYEVGVAQNQQELHEIFRLRKRVYVNELQYINHDNDFLSDNLDQFSKNYFVKFMGKTVGILKELIQESK
ncbi:MAG: hypothetical protein FD145_1227 [Candidatus Saganbacteria bacterium]|uniref:Uncharacterized protein n=1 Tax=Candidatus Saganbacteria bacterium TaxID=2575572 RepID=A0A833L091_UNCSA|nr:MAG: hypothetical protein FD145_1227 [Candidatus Saganbacteria bacterium]